MSKEFKEADNDKGVNNMRFHSRLPLPGSYHPDDLIPYLPQKIEYIGKVYSAEDFIVVVLEALYNFAKNKNGGPLHQLLNSNSGEVFTSKLKNVHRKDFTNTTPLILLRHWLEGLGNDVDWPVVVDRYNSSRSVKIENKLDNHELNPELSQQLYQLSLGLSFTEDQPEGKKENSKPKFPANFSSISRLEDAINHPNQAEVTRIHLAGNGACSLKAIEALVVQFENLKFLTLSPHFFKVHFETKTNKMRLLEQHNIELQVKKYGEARDDAAREIQK